MHSQSAIKPSDSSFEAGDKILANAKIGVHLVGADGTILWANRCELDLLGYTAEEYLMHPIADFHVDADVIDTILNLLTSDTELTAFPARLRAKDGSTKHVLINSNVHRCEGEFVHTRCFTTAISEPVYQQLRLELLSAHDD